MEDKFYAIDKYVSVKPGEPFRLLPITKLVRGGKVREVTPELLHEFKLPHFNPAIKLGSHNPETRAGGHIVGLEVRDDGLYAIPEFTPQGEKALARGDFRYHSPEIIWQGALEDPKTGDKIQAPIIMGDALLHTPHLGEQVALYSLSIMEDSMTTNEDMVPVGAVAKLLGSLGFKPDTQAPIAPEPEPKNEAENYEVEYNEAQAEVDRLTATVEKMEAEASRAERIQEFSAELGDAVEAEVYESLADIPDEAAAVLYRGFKALAAQAAESDLEEEVGDAGNKLTGSPDEVFGAEILKVQTEKGISYPEAVQVVQAEQPELFNSWYSGGDA